MNDHANRETGWEQCPTGEISGMVGRIKGHQRNVFAAQLAGGAAFGILLGLVFVGLAGPREHDFGGITCTEVREAGRAYMAGELDADFSARIKIHLAECPTCGPMFRQKVNEQAGRYAPRSRAIAQADGGGHSESVCPHCGHYHPRHGRLAAASIDFLQPLFASAR